MRRIRGVLLFIFAGLCGWGCGGGGKVVLSKASITFWEKEVDALRPRFVDWFSREKVLLDVGSFFLVSSPRERRYFEQDWGDGSGELGLYPSKIYRIEEDGSRHLCGLRLGVKSSWPKKPFGSGLGGVDKPALKGLEEIVFLVRAWFDRPLVEKQIESILGNLDLSKVMVTIQSCGGEEPEFPNIPRDVRFLRVLGGFSSYDGIRNAAELKCLGIRGGDFGERGLGVIRSLKSLEFLDLSELFFESDLNSWESLAGLENLRVLKLNRVVGPWLDDDLEERPKIHGLRRLERLLVFRSGGLPFFQGPFQFLKEVEIFSSPGPILDIGVEGCPELEKVVLAGVTREMMEVGRKWSRKNPAGRVLTSFPDFFTFELARSERLDVFLNSIFIDRRAGGWGRRGGRMKYYRLRINDPNRIRKLLGAFIFKTNFNHLLSKVGFGRLWLDGVGRGGRFNVAVFNFYRKGRGLSTIWWDIGLRVYWDRVPLILKISENSSGKILHVLEGFIGGKGN